MSLELRLDTSNTMKAPNFHRMGYTWNAVTIVIGKVKKKYVFRLLEAQQSGRPLNIKLNFLSSIIKMQKNQAYPPPIIF